MKTIEAIKHLNGISAYQKGLFTAAQAEKAGVERHTLSRLEKAGNIERLEKGVYRMGGAPSPREEDVLAIWLSLDPESSANERLTGDKRFVATGVTAAWLQELGEVGPTPYEFSSTIRKQTQRQKLKIRKRALPDEEVTIVNGIPATKPAQTVLDLIDEGYDLSLISSVLHDALKKGLIDDKDNLARNIDQRGRKLGLLKGESLFQRMLNEG